ncbi:hypothetical protein M3J09_011549 [Ascochyta lentis]
MSPALSMNHQHLPFYIRDVLFFYCRRRAHTSRIITLSWVKSTREPQADRTTVQTKIDQSHVFNERIQ